MTPRDKRETALDAARERIGRRLQESIDRLRDDIARVEYWAVRGRGFCRPVPDYQASGTPLHRHLLPQQSDGGGPERSPQRDRHLLK